MLFSDTTIYLYFKIEYIGKILLNYQFNFLKFRFDMQKSEKRGINQPYFGQIKSDRKSARQKFLDCFIVTLNKSRELFPKNNYFALTNSAIFLFLDPI